MTTNGKPNIAKSALPAAPQLTEYHAHELAALLPMIEGHEFDALKADIKRNGIQQPIVIFEGKILDGRNRYKAAKECGHEFTAANFKDFNGSYADAEAFVISANIHRRQMTNAQKQDFIKRMIGKYPEASNRQIARICCLSHVTVAAVREKILRPPEVVKFEKFKEVWEELDDDHRAAFVKEFATDIKEMLT